MASVINFVEKQRTVMIHNYIVYVCGVDISPFIEDLTITFNDRNSPNSADFSVTNALEQFVLTADNLVRGSFRRTSDRYTEMPKYKIYQAKRHLSRRVSGGKVKQINPKADNLPEVDYITGLTQTQLADTNNALAAEFMQQDFLERYAFGIGSCIFSRFDTVRIFIKNPYDNQNADRWIPFFTGTIQNKPMMTDYVNGSSRINVSAMDVRSEMAGMRVSTNPVNNFMFEVGNSNEKDQRANSVFFDSDQAGFFKDLYPVDKNTSGTATVGKAKGDNIFDNKSFVDMSSMLITGLTGWVGNDKSYAKKGAGGVEEGTGVGFFKPGQVIRYGNSKNTSVTKKDNFRSDLEEWDNLCLFGTSKKFFSEADCHAIGRASFWYRFDTNAKDDKQLTRFTPFDGYMHFLLPAEGLKIASMIVQSFDGFRNITKNPDWTNRFELLTRVCQMVDYEWSVTGNGDIIFEFPMYDFYPETYGGNSSIYQVDKHVKSDNIADESGEIPAAIEATTSLTLFGDRQAQEAKNKAAETAAAGMPADISRTVIVSPILASKYGAKIISHSFTGVPVEGLNKAATIEFQKRLADANKLSFEYTYRPYVRPNRPLLHTTRGRMGKTTSVSYSIPVYPGEPTNSASVHCVKTPLFKDGRNVFQHITGAANMPLSYNAILENTEINTDNGMTVINQTSNSKTGTQVASGSGVDESTKEPARNTLQANSHPNWNRFDSIFDKYGKLNNIPPSVLKAIALNESNLGLEKSVAIGLENPTDVTGSVSTDGKSWGIMQMRYDIAKADYDPAATVAKLNDPDYQVKIASKHLAKSYKAFDNLEYIVKSYNRGIGGTRSDIARGSFSPDVQQYWERFSRNLSKVVQG